MLTAKYGVGEEIGNSFLFEREWYLAAYPDVAVAGVDPLHHYVSYGAAEGRQPNRWFDVAWYVDTYPDAGRALDPLLHYLQVGAARKYSTHPLYTAAHFDRILLNDDCQASTSLGEFIRIWDIIERSSLFDRKWYAAAYPDVGAAGVDCLMHFLLYGIAENRNPSRAFDVAWYRATYPDVAGNPLIHYLSVGADQGFTTHPAFHFDLLPGRRTGGYPADATPLGQLLRAWIAIESTFLFERDWYLDKYKDVAASGGDPLQHYLLHGVAEGRNPNRLFDTRWYLSQYPEVAAAGLDPLAHYILAGAKLGYTSHPFFPREEYGKYEAEARQGFSPLEDFLHRVLRGRPALFPTFGPYDVYRVTQDNLRRSRAPADVRHIEIMIRRPHFLVLVDTSDRNDLLSTLASLQAQTYSRYVTTRSVSDATAAVLTGDGPTHLIWLDGGDELETDALYQLAAELNVDPDLDLIYFDHDVALNNGLSWPFHKPSWSPDYVESSDYIGPAACFRLAEIKDLIGDVSSRYDLTLRFTEATRRIKHINRVLLHRPIGRDAALPEQQANDMRAIAGRLRRTGRCGTVRPTGSSAASYEIEVSLQGRPLVSIVLPTAARVIDYFGRKIDLIVECVEGISSTSTYKKIEFVIVDNGDFDRGRLAHMKSVPITYVTYTPAEVNIARKINMGVSYAHGAVVLILNDDVVPLSADWIEKMLAHLEKPHVGVVGAKLLYPDNTLQHVGMAACDGHLHHVRHRWPKDDRGYADSTCAVRNYVAVTGAVSMISKQLFIAAGGYPEQLPIDYNDVHLCYAVRELGYSVVYEPRAELLHYHAVSAHRDPRPQDLLYFLKRWASMSDDPYYNQYCFENAPATFNLSYTDRKH